MTAWRRKAVANGIMGIDPQTLRARLAALIEPALADMGCELVELELSGGTARTLLRLYIDREGGVGIEDCARASRAVSALLDVDDPIATRYLLEVSSPGLNRPLTKPEHFRRFLGQQVRVKTRRPLRGNAKNYGGTLKAYLEEPSRIEVADEGGIVTIPLDDILKARLEYSFDEAPAKPGRRPVCAKET